MKNILIALIVLLSSNDIIAQNDSQNTNTKEGYAYFLDFFVSKDPKIHDKAYDHIRKNWSESYEVLAIETLYFLQNSRNSSKILSLLERKTRKSYGNDFNKWYEYIWNKKPTYTPSFYKFKAFIHHSIDAKFSNYFLNRENQSTIRLDEVRWGGVVQDGIPPLRNPKMIPAKSAQYLDDDDIVFGISINGDTRAYPKRILAWHEMFTDTVGGIPVAGVYCTLCGTVILYKTEKDGVTYQIGTSGFLYRSNKLMYDQKTQSLWNTLGGKPVLGPLVGKGIELEYLSVVTTNWGAWKKRHPETTVLSSHTGHKRDYGEGVAYHNYFATDNLMFAVPKEDRRLKNKQEILAIRLPEETDENIAISSRFLQKKHIYTHQINNKNFTVFTDNSGAHRVFFTLDKKFVSYDNFSTMQDEEGNIWKLYEDRLENTATKETLERLQTHNAFWFGYQAAFPEVKLIK